MITVHLWYTEIFVDFFAAKVTSAKCCCCGQMTSAIGQDRAAQKRCLAQLRSLCPNLKSGTYLIAHLRRPSDVSPATVDQPPQH